MKRPAVATKWMAVAVLVGSTLPTFASEAGEGSNTFLGLNTNIWLTANLLLFLGILARFLGPGILGFLNSRGEQIQQNLALAQKQQQEVADMKAVLEKKVADLEAEMSQVLERARTDGERERQEILAQAQAESERLLQLADDEIHYRFSRARQELTRHTAELASELARKKLESQIGEPEHRKLFDDNLRRLGGDVS